FFVLLLRPPRPPLFPYTTLFRSSARPSDRFGLSLGTVTRRMYTAPAAAEADVASRTSKPTHDRGVLDPTGSLEVALRSSSTQIADRKSTRLNSSHDQISYAVFCL